MNQGNGYQETHNFERKSSLIVCVIDQKIEIDRKQLWEKTHFLQKHPVLVCGIFLVDFYDTLPGVA